MGAALQLVLVPAETKLVETPANDTCLPGFELEPDGIGVAPGRVEDAGEEAPVLTHRQGPALVGLDGVSLGSLPSAKARSQIRPDAFLGFELQPHGPVMVGLSGEETPDVPPPVGFVVERRLGELPGPDEPDAGGQGGAPSWVLAGGDVPPPLLSKEAVVPARHELRPGLQRHPVGRLHRAPVVAHHRRGIAAGQAARHGAVDLVAGPDLREGLRPARRHEDRRVAVQAIGTGVAASPEGIDGPAKAEAVPGDVVDDALRGYLVERHPAELRGLEAPHDGLSRKQGEHGRLGLSVVVPAGQKVVPAHHPSIEHMFD